tara:strand:+ start:287 stop:2272 length:1986 start_codon:yes stop_codon:yes gene_type:complete
MDAYGYNALSGFLGSSNIKQQRAEELRYLQAIRNLQRQRENEANALEQQNQQYLDAAFNAAVELTTGPNARQKDLLDLQELSQNLLDPINEKIRMAGSLQKAQRLGINEDIRNYQYKLLNNDKVFQMKQNQDALKNIIAAQGDPNTAHLIAHKDLESLNNWRAEKSDVITYRGQLNGELNMEFINSYTAEEPISLTDYILFNQQTLIADYAYHVSDDPNAEQMVQDARDNPFGIAMQAYARKRLTQDPNYDPNIKFGTAEIKTGFVDELINTKDLLFPSTGLRAAELQNAGGFGNYVKTQGLIPELEGRFGIDADNRNLLSKGSYTMDAAAQLFVNKPEQYERFLTAGLGNNLYVDSDGFKLKIEGNEQMLGTLFNSVGASMKGDVPFIDTFSEDMKIRGVFLGMKAVYTDQNTGEVKEKLLMKGAKDLDPTNRKKYIDELLKNVATKESVSFRPAYILQLEEPDILGFEGASSFGDTVLNIPTDSDLFYKEIKVKTADFRQRGTDEEYDKAMSNARNYNAQVTARKETLDRRALTTAKANAALDNMYAGDMSGGFKVLMNQYEIPFRSVANTNEIPRQMVPYLMSDMFNIANQQSGDLNTNVNGILQSFSNLEATMPEYFNILKSGNVSALMNWHKENSTEQEFKRKKTNFQLWQKYFKN